MSPHRALRRVAVATTLFAVMGTGDGWAGGNDLKLLNLCPQVPSATLGVQECSWIERDATGLISGVNIDAEGRSNFRSLMSELGVVMAPRVPMPAGTIGFAGFQLTGELGFTQISSSKTFWNGVNAVAPQTPNISRPSSMLTTMGVFLRKGIWLPAPSLEVGGGVVHLLDSQLLSWQAYTKLALHEGFHDLPIPSLSVRGMMAQLSGTDQASLRTFSIDVLISRGFGLLKTLRVEPYGGWSLLLMKASGKAIDFTPLCDSGQAAAAAPGQAVTGQCSLAQSGTDNDLKANATFPTQDVITRYRVFGGAKVKFGLLNIIAQYELYLAGHSRDENVIPAVDRSGQQSAVSLSVGLEF